MKKQINRISNFHGGGIPPPPSIIHIRGVRFNPDYLHVLLLSFVQNKVYWNRYFWNYDVLIILRKIATSKWEFRKLTHAFLILINASLILRLELSFTMSSSLRVGARTETWHCAYKNNISPTARLLPATQRQSIGCKSLLIFPESMNLAHLGTLPVPRLHWMLWCGRFRDVIGLGVRQIPSKPLTHGISFDNGSLRCMM